MKKFILIPALAAGVLLAGCGGSKPSTPEAQIREMAEAFQASIKNNDGKCLKYVSEDAQGMLVAFAGGCNGLHDIWEAAPAKDKTNDWSKVKIVVTGKTATIHESNGEVDNAVLEDGTWKWDLSNEDKS